MRQSGLKPALLTAAFVLLLTSQAAVAGSARFAGFPKSVKNYIDLRHKVESELPKLSAKANAEQIAQHRTRLAEALRAARPNARQGDIFTPEVSKEFKQVLRAATRKKSVKDAVREGNPTTEGNPAKIKLAVNAQYPVDEPVSTVPPAVLLELPELPEVLKYCFVGTSLVLLDAQSNLIIDYIPNATA